jgi:TolB protein
VYGSSFDEPGFWRWSAARLAKLHFDIITVMNGMWQGRSKLFWGGLLVLGLLVESCLLAAGVGWVMRQEDIPLNLGADRTPLSAGVPTLARETPAGETPSPPPLDEETLAPQASETPETTPTQANAFEPPVFDDPPPGKIVYVCFDGEFDQICIMNGDGSGQRQLTDVKATNFYPSLSPDGRQIVFSSNRDGNFEIYRMDIDGGNVEQLTDNMGNLFAPEISPKGNRIIFTAATGSAQNIWVLRLDNGNTRPFTDTGSDIDPTWSPNAEQILFASGRSGETQLYIMNADGRNVRPVRRSSPLLAGGRSDWSPDGGRIAFYAGPVGDRDIFTAAVDGSDVRQLTDGGDNLAPTYSPDGEWIAFTSFRDGNNEIYVMRRDGSQVTRLTGSPNSDWQPRWGP